MKRHAIIKKSILVGLAIFSTVVSGSMVANAQTTRNEEVKQTIQERQTTVQENIAERKEAAQQRLTEAKLKACQAHEEKISNTMVRIADRGQRQIDLFTTISDRTQEFYVNKGKMLANYDELVADAMAKKEAAQTAIDSVKLSSAEFSCEGDNPRGVATAFKENLRLKIDALKAYKTSVKNLIVGVKSVQSTETSTENEGAN